MPVRGPRFVYRITLIRVPNDDQLATIDPAITTGANVQTSRDAYVKMKRSIGDWLSLLPISYNDAIWTGTFAAGQTGATNTGTIFRRRVGGFKEASYKLTARTRFVIPELVRQQDGNYIQVNSPFRSISIGFPKGHSVTEIINWLATTPRIGEISTVTSPSGASTPVYVGGAQEQ